MPSDDGRATVEVSLRRARNKPDLAQERMSAVMISPGACPPSRRKGVSAATYVFVSAGSGRPVGGDPHSTLDHRCRLRGSRLRRSGHAARGDKRRQPECFVRVEQIGASPLSRRQAGPVVARDLHQPSRPWTRRAVAISRPRLFARASPAHSLQYRRLHCASSPRQSSRLPRR